MKRLLFAPLLLLFFLTIHAQQIGLPIRVTETAGIRRTAFPVSTRLEIPEHALADLSHVRLRLAAADVPAQLQIGTRWTDGSVRALDVDFNASPGPRETLDYTLEYGPNIVAPPAPRGLTVTKNEDTIQVGSVAFSRSGSPLFRSVKYREEDIGPGANGMAVVDASGHSHNLDIDGVTLGGVLPAPVIVKPGPLNVVLRYTGNVDIDSGYQVPFVMTVEMPNSKSWVKITATVQDPGQRLRAITFHTALSLGPYPWLWDFGTSKGTYGVLRATGDRASITREPADSALAAWHVEAASGGRPEQTIESATEAIAPQWGHVQGGKEAIAFAANFPASGSGTYTLSIDGTGLLTAQVAPTRGMRELSLTVYEHFVAAPAQIGAATTPAAMLAPLEVR